MWLFVYVYVSADECKCVSSCLSFCGWMPVYEVGKSIGCAKTITLLKFWSPNFVLSLLIKKNFHCKWKGTSFFYSFVIFWGQDVYIWCARAMHSDSQKQLTFASFVLFSVVIQSWWYPVYEWISVTEQNHSIGHSNTSFDTIYKKCTHTMLCTELDEARSLLSKCNLIFSSKLGILDTSACYITNTVITWLGASCILAI